jgi:hypothetical protein
MQEFSRMEICRSVALPKLVPVTLSDYGAAGSEASYRNSKVTAQLDRRAKDDGRAE